MNYNKRGSTPLEIAKTSVTSKWAENDLFSTSPSGANELSKSVGQGEGACFYCLNWYNKSNYDH